MALDLPADERARLAAWRDELVRGRDELRPVSEVSLHVTLVFIGHRPEDDIPDIARAVRESAAGRPPALLRSLGVVPVPKRGAPRLFALDLEDEGGHAADVQASVSRALEHWYEPEKRRFWPHITLARVRKGTRPHPLHAEAPAMAFEASEVTLYRSRLSRRGASYEALERVPLG